MVVPFVVCGVGMTLFFVPLASVVLGSVPRSLEGVASGANAAFRELGGVLGIAVLGAVFSAHGGYASGQDYVDGLTPAVSVGAAVVAVGARQRPVHPRSAPGSPGASTRTRPSRPVDSPAPPARPTRPTPGRNRNPHARSACRVDLSRRPPARTRRPAVDRRSVRGDQRGPGQGRAAGCRWPGAGARTAAGSGGPGPPGRPGRWCSTPKREATSISRASSTA